jgi:hypothetical protein
MRNAAQARRAIWLRRTRLATGWIAALATVATLLIAAVAGSASTAKKVALSLPPSHPARRSAALSARIVVRRHDARSSARRVHAHAPARHAATVVRVRAKPVHVAPAPAPTPAPPPAPPVVVSGGS